MPEPSIKGAAIQATVERIHALLESGELARAELELALSPRALAIVDEKVEPSLFYPVTAVSELGELLVERVGKGSYEFMIEVGARTADRFQAEGVFAAFIAEAAKRGERMGHTLVRISELALNFGDWTYEGEDLRNFRVDVRDCEALPEETRHSISGFITRLVFNLTGDVVKVETERPQPDHVIFRSTG